MIEDLVIEKCPLCGEPHPYLLEVSRSIVMGLMLHPTNIETKSRVFTRLFYCPDKCKKFQASFRLYYTSNSPIESVDVKGVKGESEKRE